MYTHISALVDFVFCIYDYIRVGVQKTNSPVNSSHVKYVTLVIYLLYMLCVTDYNKRVTIVNA